ncbi:hypothetical protein V1264_020867 [Littorina saxatilis]|uniref:Endonuclease n=2 Tax=Littorina saxatilis TaxID=31220 RepID=A0AAN9GDB9_9CAEN
MGSDAERIFERFELAPDDAKNFDVVLEKYNQYFLPQKNVIHERATFHKRNQREDESIEEYVRQLYELSENCEFADKENTIRDRLVLGIRDPEVSEKLQLESTLTLPKAVQIARQNELIKSQIQEQRGQGKTSVDSVRGRSRFRSGKFRQHTRGGQNSLTGEQRHMRGSQKVSRGGSFSQFSQHSDGQECGKCGRDHPKDGQCPARGQQCRRCKRKGHFARMCRSVREVETEHEEDEFFVDSVIADNSKPWTTVLKIKDIEVQFKIDTGADLTIINEKTFDRFKNKPKLSATRVQLSSPEGRLSTKGEFFAKTNLKGQTFNFRVIVVRNSLGNNLLSRNAAEKMGLVKRLEEIHADVFGKTGLLKTEPVKINMKPGTQPYCVTTARRVPFPLQKKVKAELERMQAAGIIKEVKETTDWCAPMVPVVKPNGSVRICVDFKRLNEGVKRPHCMLPNLDDIAPKMVGSKFFTTLDASSGFFQIPLQEDSSLLTTFMTPFGRFAFQRVPMGISLGPECFQTKMKETLEGLEGCDAIMDDTIIFGRTEEEHDRRLDAVLKRIEERGLKLNREKCKFKKTEVKYFGHIISEHGVRPDPEKVKAITDMQPPSSLTELRTVCGMFNYLSKFVPGLATDLKPITDLMKADTAWAWRDEQQKAFEAVKKKISSTSALEFYHQDRKTVVSADSSSYGMGATLMQWKGGQLVPIAYASRTLTDAERRYAQIEKECLASTWACEKFAKYLIGLDSFDLLTDHKPLVPLMTSKDLDRAPVRCQRLLLRLMRFNAKVQHVPGKNLVIADALSRSPLTVTKEDKDLSEVVSAYVDFVEESWPIAESRLDVLRAATVHDAELQQVIQYVCNGWPQSVSANLQAYQQVQGELSLIRGLLVCGKRVVIPVSERPDLLKKLHESHQGLHKCRERAQMSVWWPGLSRDLKTFIENCSECRQHRPSQRSEPLKPTVLPERPWQQLGMDLLSFEGKDYMVVVDYYSRWLEILRLTSTTSAAVIAKLRSIFMTHGFPEVVKSDNGTQFQSKEFRDFAKEFDFRTSTSSPVFPQANGEAESGVKIAKKILRQSSPDIALLNYRATPHSSTGVSPSQALMGRQLRTRLPVLPEVLVPRPVSDADIRQADQQAKDNYKFSYDKRHGATPLSKLVPGDQVLVKTDAESTWKKKGTVVAADADNRTYLINSPSTGVLRRNRKHLQQIPSPRHDIIPVSPEHSPAASDSKDITSSSDSKDIGDSKDINRRVTRAVGGYTAAKPLRYREEEVCAAIV